MFKRKAVSGDNPTMTQKSELDGKDLKAPTINMLKDINENMPLIIREKTAVENQIIK